jgi:preprotein translocase subunit SecD
MMHAVRALLGIAVSFCLCALAACQATVTGDGARSSPAQLEFRKVLTTEPGQPAPSSGRAPSSSPALSHSATPLPAADQPAARQHPALADPAVARPVLDALDCSAPDPLRGHVDPAQLLVACDPAGPTKYVLDRAILTGADVARASAEPGPSGGWQVAVTFTDAGAGTWADFTAANVDNQVAIVLDASVVSAPTIQEAILAGTTIISSQFTKEQAEQLATQLNRR